MKRKDYFLLAGILVLHLLLLLILKFTAWPEMTLWPYLMTKGWFPYRDIAVAHTPLLLVALTAVYKIFGTGILQLKIFTWMLILLFDVLVFVIAKKLWNVKIALISLFAYSLISLFFDINGLWFDLFMGIFAFASFYFIMQKKWTFGGVFWALAFLSKQTAVWFLIPIVLEMVIESNILRRPLKEHPFKVVGRFTMGVIGIFVSSVLLLFIFHLLPSFWDWAGRFGVFTLPQAAGQIQLPTLKTFVAAIFPFLVFIPLFFTQRSRFWNIIPWAVAGFLGAYPRFEYFHFLPALPFLAISVGLVFSEEFSKRRILAKVFILLYLIGNIYLVTTYFIRNVNEGTRFYETNVRDVETYIKYNTNSGDRIFVLNWWDNIYGLTDTLPSTRPWIPQLSWYTELPGVQEKMVEDLEQNPPKLIIYNSYASSGLSAYTPRELYDYVMDNYKIDQTVGGVAILVHR